MVKYVLGEQPDYCDRAGCGVALVPGATALLHYTGEYYQDPYDERSLPVIRLYCSETCYRLEAGDG